MKHYFINLDESKFFQVSCDRFEETENYYYFWIGDIIVCDICKTCGVSVELYEEK